MNVFTKAFSNTGYIMFSRDLAKLIGNEAAILFGELCSEYNYFEQTGELDEEGAFFSTMENLEDRINLTPYQQRKAIKVLEDMGLLITFKKGSPPLKYFLLQAQNVESVFSNVKNFNIQMLNTPKCEKNSHLNVKNFDVPNNNYNRDKYNRDSCIEDKKENKQININDLPPLKALEVYKEEFNLSPELYESFKDYLNMRRKKGDKLNANIVKRAIETLFKLSADPGEQLTILNNSIVGCWSGLFPLKPYQRQGGYQQPNRNDRPAEPEEEDALTRIRKRLEAEEAARKEEEARQNEYD